MKLSVWAKSKGITYKTAWNMFKKGLLNNAYKLPTGTIIIDEDKSINKEEKVAIYARVSSSENKKNLDTQAERLKQYCIAKGYQISKIIKEIGSGLDDTRPKLESLLLDNTISIIVVEHKDCLARFGFNYISKLLFQNNRSIEIVNKAENVENDLMEDFVAIITSFTARLYGKCGGKRKTKRIIKELNNK